MVSVLKRILKPDDALLTLSASNETLAYCIRNEQYLMPSASDKTLNIYQHLNYQTFANYVNKTTTHNEHRGVS